ncbi:MAG: aldehyde ferredoxin oxidoreductase family protein [Candidatus Bathyarchaeia archaeon]
MLGGYMGKLLRVDLGKGRVSEEALDLAVARMLFAGSGYGAWMLRREVPPSADPLGAENELIILTGPFTGSLIPGGTRAAAVAKSPLTGIFAEANTAGFFPTEIKFAGYDGLVFIGRSASPVYLNVVDNQASLLSAKHLWGMDTYETMEAVRKELGDRQVKVACIGPAGEKKARLACIINDDGRAFGRAGLGAVMGSKNLKAIAVRGHGKVPVAHPKEFQASLQKYREGVLNAQRVKSLRRDGTAAGVETFEKTGNLPVKNWTQGTFPGAVKISGPAMTKTILKRPYACFACPVACGRVIEIQSGPYRGLAGPGPEYETIATLGSMCLNDDLAAIAKANDLCNRYGLDTISTGATIAFAMECYDKGLLSREDTGGIDLTWGNADAVVQLAEHMGRMEGFGRVLADGVKAAAGRIGRGSERYALEVKGLELPAHEPRRFKSMGLDYATANRGACHMQGLANCIERGLLMPEYGLSQPMDGFTTEGKAAVTILYQNLCSALDALGLCKFPVFGVTSFDLIAESYTYLTGWQIDRQKILDRGGLIYDLKRAYNVSCGVKPSDDRLPDRFTKEPLPDGFAKGQVCELEPMLEEYYKLRRWNRQTGAPEDERLRAL